MVIEPKAPGWIQSQTFDILNTCRLGQDSRRETGAHIYAQAHISTQPAPSIKDAWLPLTYEDKIGRSRAEPSPCRWPQARYRKRRLSRLTSSPPHCFGRSRSRVFNPSG